MVILGCLSSALRICVHLFFTLCSVRPTARDLGEGVRSHLSLSREFCWWFAFGEFLLPTRGIHYPPRISLPSHDRFRHCFGQWTELLLTQYGWTRGSYHLPSSVIPVHTPEPPLTSVSGLDIPLSLCIRYSDSLMVNILPHFHHFLCQCI